MATTLNDMCGEDPRLGQVIATTETLAANGLPADLVPRIRPLQGIFPGNHHLRARATELLTDLHGRTTRF
jgi:hypothetical protein